MSMYRKAIYAGLTSLVAALGVAAESNGITLSEALTALGAAMVIGGGVAGITNAPSQS